MRTKAGKFQTLLGVVLATAAALPALGDTLDEGRPCDHDTETPSRLERRLAELVSPGVLVLRTPTVPARDALTVDPRDASTVRNDVLLAIASGEPVDSSPSALSRRVRVSKEGGVTVARVTGFDPVPSFTARGWKDIRGVQQGEVDLPYGILLGGDFDRRDGIHVGQRAELELVRTALPRSDIEFSASAGQNGAIRTDGGDLSGSLGPRTRILLLVPIDENGRKVTVDLSGGPEVDIRNRRARPGGNATFMVIGSF